MKIQVAKISPEGSRYEGEEPPEILDLESDKFAHADGPVRYEFDALKVGSEIVVRGRVVAPVKLLCGRCGDFFSTTLEVSSFLRGYEFSEGQEELDLTPDIREDVLLELPAFPKCSWQGEGICPFSGVDVSKLKLPEVPAVDNRWAALDGLRPEPVNKKTGKKAGRA
jgi:uncharacterized metal-binding protein YceD (DUF177 family)